MQGTVAPTFEWSNKLLIPKIRSFVRMYSMYCLDKKITPTFGHFLFYKWNGIVSETYKFLYTAPREFLAGSRAFQKFYYSLDKDFRDDIFTAEEYRQTKREIQINHELKQYLQTLMKEDFIL